MTEQTPCDCKISGRTLSQQSFAYNITFCPLHKSAPELLEYLEIALDTVLASGRHKDESTGLHYEWYEDAEKLLVDLRNAESK